MLLTHSIGLCILIFYPRTVLNSGISSQTIFVNQFYLFQSVPLLFQHHYPPPQQDAADRCEVTLGFKAGETPGGGFLGSQQGVCPLGWVTLVGGPISSTRVPGDSGDSTCLLAINAPGAGSVKESSVGRFPQASPALIWIVLNILRRHCNLPVALAPASTPTSSSW